jgi:hypothetical protein
MGKIYVDKDVVQRMSANIANKREEMKKKGLRTTEATRQIFEIPAYDWTKDPNHFVTQKGRLPADRCSHCGFKYIGWKKYPFCNICTIAMYGDAYIEPQIRDFINMRTRIPEGMTEANFVIREKKRDSEEAYKKLKTVPVQSDFKVAKDLE